MSACDVEIERQLKQFDALVDEKARPLAPPKVRRRKTFGNEPKFDLRKHLYRIFGVRPDRGSRYQCPDRSRDSVGDWPRSFEVPERFGIRLVAGFMPAQRYQRRQNSEHENASG